MRSWRRWRGQHGEQMAVQFLQRQGYCILHQNYRCRGGEVDIVAWDGPTLVFIEVKTKGQALFGAPQAMVDARKQKKIVHVAMVYVQQHQLHSPFAQSTAHIRNCKLPVELSTQPQPLQDSFLPS